MPQAVPIVVGAAISAGGAYLAGTSIMAAVLTSAIMSAGKMALGMITNSLTSKQKRTSTAGLNGDRTFQVRQPTPPRHIVYGEVKKSGSLMLAENTENNKYVHYVVALAAHEVDAINTIYINDTAVYNDQIDASGAVIAGKFSGSLWIKKHLGTDDQAADPDLISAIAGLDSNFRLRGTAYVYAKHKTNSDLFPNGANISARIRGKKLYDPRLAAEVFSYNPTLVWRDYKTSTRYGMREKTTRISDTHVASAANICDEFVQTLPVTHVVSDVDAAADALNLSGDLLQLQTGDRVQVTTTGTLPSGISAATDYYVIVYKEKKEDAVSCAIKLASSYANAVASTALNITSVGSGTHTVTKNGEPRYTASGVFECTDGVEHFDNLDDILVSMAGYAYKSGALWLVFAGAYQTPTISYGIDDLVDKVKYNPRHPRRDRYNAVRGVYISPANYDQPDNYPAITSTLFQTKDGGERRYLQLDLPLTSRPQTAQRLAKIALQKHRREGTVILPLDITGMLSQPGDTIAYTDAKFGFDEKTFEVVDYEFAATGDGDNPQLGVTISCAEIDPAVYDFDYTTEEVSVPPPPASRLPNPFLPPLPPSSLTLSSGTNELFIAGEGTVITRIKATIGASPDGYTSNYSIRWKRSVDSVWQSQLVRADTTEHYINAVEDGVAYDVSVASVNQLGILGEYIYAYNHVVVGKTEPPPSPDTFTIAILADGTRRFSFGLDNPPPDVRVGGGFQIRYFVGVTSDWDAMLPLHNGTLTVSPFETNELAAGTYTMACKVVDSTGNLSTAPIFINATIGNPRLKNALYQQIENPTWPGTKTDCFADSDGALHATSAGDWTNLPATWNDISPTWDTIITNHTTIIYESPVIDLGINTTFMPLVSVAGTGTPTITIKTGSTADGGVVGSYAAISGQVSGKRYIQMRVEMTDATAPVITEMSTILDGDVAYEEYPDVNTATETASWFQRIAAGHFRIGSKAGDISAITFARIMALQGVGAGWTWVLVNKSSTVGGYAAAEFKIYNASGTLADALIDVEMQGVT